MAVIVPVSGTETIMPDAGDTVSVKAGVVIQTDLAPAFFGLNDNLILRHSGHLGATGSDAFLLFGANYDMWIRDTGTVSGFHGVAIQGGSGRFINDGEIQGENYGMFLNGATNAEIWNRADIFGGAIGMVIAQATSDSVIRNYGTIASTGPDGAGLTASADVSNVQIINAGTIRGDFFGVSLQGDGASLSNAGLIDGGVMMGGVFGLTLVNRGDITASPGGTTSVWTLAATEADVIKNFGTLVGNVSLLGGDDYLLNGPGAVIVGEVDMGAGNDTVYQRGGISDTVFLGEGQDIYNGVFGGRALVAGEEGDDRIIGGVGDDGLDGGSGNDAIRGNAGADNIAGRAGRDVMWGGADADTFFYYDYADSEMGFEADVIRDFESGVDHIHLAYLLGDPLDFNGTAGFTGGGQGSIRYNERGAGGVDLRIDLDGNQTADMRIVILGSDSLTVDDFIMVI